MNTKGFQDVFQERLDIAVRKNNDYGQMIDNIGSAGLQGIAVRLYDKACRLMSLTMGKNEAAVNESLRDTLLDAANYADFGVMIIDGKWDEDSSIAPGRVPEEMPVGVVPVPPSPWWTKPFTSGDWLGNPDKSTAAQLITGKE